MSKIYYPKKSIMVPASSPHPENTEYKVSIGNENWNGNFIDVIKVQMVYNGVVSGRRSPSYPINTDDELRVREAIEILKHNCTISLSKDISFCNDTFFDELKALLLNNHDDLTGFERCGDTLGNFKLILNFKASCDKATASRIINSYINLLSLHGITGNTNYIEKAF